MSENKKIVFPSAIPSKDMPLIVLSDHTSGFVEWAIKWRTKASYNHIMTMINPSLFVSQGNTFSEIGIERYMKRGNRLKFWGFKDLTDDERVKFRREVNNELAKNWFQKSYDYLGIVGQAFGIKWLNNPWKNYCSERVARHVSIILKDVPKHPSPEDLDEFFKTHDRMYVYGYWFSE